MSNFRKIEYIECFYINLKRLKNFSSRICLRILSCLIKLYFFSILFAMKVNKNLRFCVDYRKFNIIIKWNWYFLFLIKEIIEKIIKCKHFIKLNIIVVFNIFRMHFNNENYTTFIIILNVYKYCIFLFNLINDLNSFQQYINDVL